VAERRYATRDNSDATPVGEATRLPSLASLAMYGNAPICFPRAAAVSRAPAPNAARPRFCFPFSNFEDLAKRQGGCRTANIY
jgi:hypothetical protein